MKFLVDACTGTQVAELLRDIGHDVYDASDEDVDPGDEALLAIALAEERVVITMDHDFGTLVFLHRQGHAGLIRIPNLRVSPRLQLVEQLVHRYHAEIEQRLVITVKNDRVRVTEPFDWT